MTTHEEIAFTRPRADCPHPEYWHAVDGQATEDEVSRLLANMVRTLQPEVVLETGTHIGATAEYIGRALRANGHGHLTTIELNKERAFVAGNALLGLPITVITGSSMKVMPPDNIDLLWLDSAMYAADGRLQRVLEYRRLRPHLSSRAVIMVHDTGPHKPLRAALDELDDVTWIHLPTPRGVSIGRPR